MKKLFLIRLLSWMCLIGLLLTGCGKEQDGEHTTVPENSSNILGTPTEETPSSPSAPLSLGNGLSLNLADIEDQGISGNVVSDLLKHMNVQSVYMCFSMTDLLDDTGTVRENVRERYSPWFTAMKQAGVKNIMVSVSGGLWEKSYQISDGYAFPYPDGDADSLWSSYLAYYEKCFSAILAAYPQVDIWQTGTDYNLNEYAHPVAYADRNTTFVTKEKAAVCVDLSRAAKQAVETFDSQALVVLSSVAVSADYSSAAEFYEEIYSYLKSGRSPYGKMTAKDAFDAVAWKPLVNWYAFDSAEFMAGNRQIRDVMEKNGDSDTSVLLTDFGFADYGSLTYDTLQGEWLTELMNAIKKMSYVGGVYPAHMIEMREGSADEKIYSGMFRVFGKESLGAKEKAKALCLAYGGNPDYLDTYKGDNMVYEDQTYQVDAMNGIAFPVKGADERDLNVGKIMDLLETMNVECMRNWMNIRTLLASPTQINKTEVEKQKQWIAMLNNRGITKIVGMSQGWFWPDGSVNDELAAPYRDTTKGSLYMQFLETYKQSWKTLAKAFPEIQYWEVGNETNHNPFLHPTTYTTRKTTFSTEEKAQITVDMVYYAAMGIREANPDAVIIFPGMAAVNGFDGIRSFLNSAYTYIESGNALGGTDPDAYFDAVAWHMYYFSTSFTSENWLNGNNSIYQVMKDHGDGEKKVFLTEFGFSDGGSREKDAQHAEYFKEIFALADQMPYLDSLYPFRVVEDSTAAEWGGTIEIYYGMFRVFDKEHFGAKEKAKAICEIYGGDLTKLDRYLGENSVY